MLSQGGPCLSSQLLGMWKLDPGLELRPCLGSHMFVWRFREAGVQIPLGVSGSHLDTLNGHDQSLCLHVVSGSARV